MTVDPDAIVIQVAAENRQFLVVEDLRTCAVPEENRIVVVTV